MRRRTLKKSCVTRLGDLLDFGQQLVCPNLPHSLEIFVKVSKSVIFLVKSFLGNFYRHLAIFFVLVTLKKSDSVLRFKQSRFLEGSRPPRTHERFYPDLTPYER